ncbi:MULTISPECIES: SulP family inorganic anion transporter [unclassified Polaromonas]|uniref:SulP family inorganic anion transporter n=1 Tax=unclassified Polaromonas TaxID=2638319 RepID=UPI000F08270A|nr:MULTISPECIES: SulP family inorganic anion transporter [unclassified Polaromonas]AYQ27777.1 SulP family inorganic anion transporter [Polaromonas sp. SP1]QGJ17366.1 STAS domain-containing protein [Polaromonas sp. Pch-P]
MEPSEPSASRLPTPLLERLFGDWVREVSPATLRADAMAGLLGAVLVLPQGIAFATLAGLPPAYGLYTAVIPCIIAALFGSSRHVMSGPTNANSLALFAMLSPLALAFSPLYIQLALAVTVMVGIMQWLIGALRLGVLANFISPAVLFGFTSGAALLIAVHALPDLLGLAAAPEHSAAAVLAHVFTQMTSAQPLALGVAAITLGVALLLRRLRRNWPYMLIGLAVATALAWLWSRFLHPDATPSASLRTVGQIPVPWPRFEVPRISWAQAADLIGLAFALTIVALGQAISIAKTVALRSGQRIDANREFRGQGLSNIVGGFFSSYVSCGSMNRSMPNLEAGARTPLASVFSALLLLALVAVSAPLLAQIPMAALAALLVLVAFALLDFARWQQLFTLSRSDFGVALATMVATVTIRLEIAILLGMILSLMSFLYRTSKPAMRTMGFDSRGLDRQFVVIDNSPDAGLEAKRAQPLPAEDANGRSAGPPQARPAPSGGSVVHEVTSVGATLSECPQLKLLRMEGEVYFGATQHVADILHALRTQPKPQKHLLVMGKSMNFIDLAGAELWEAELAARRAMGGDLYFHRPRPEVIRMWRKTGFTSVLGPEHQFPDKFTAIATIFNKLDPEICRLCTARIFWECQSAPGPDTPTA